MRTEYSVIVGINSVSALELITYDIASIEVHIYYPLGKPTNQNSTIVEVSYSSQEIIKAGTADWIEWSYGPVKTETLVSLKAPHAIRITNPSTTKTVGVSIRGNYA